MANVTCLRCGGTGTLADGSICPDCNKVEFNFKSSFAIDAPAQYLGVCWNSDNLPASASRKYREEMSALLSSITSTGTTYHVNHLICYPNGNGKSIWSYTLMNGLYLTGNNVFGIIDIFDCREYLNSYEPEAKANYKKLTESKCVVIKIPRDLSIWHFDIIQTVLERRVQYSNFTIFLFSGSLKDLEMFDRFGKFKHLKGNGNFNSIMVHDF